MKVVSCRATVSKYKMNGMDFDGFIDKMGTLVVNQSERAPKPGQNDFINELSYDYNYVGPYHLCFHPLCCIINSNQNVLVAI
jgi:hypothetical protein